MEYLERQISDSCTKETLDRLVLDEPDRKIYKKVLENWDSIAKPLDGMGRFEAVTAQIGAILGTDEINLSKKAVIIMCADNGIVEEGVSQSGQEVTAAVAEQMGKGASSVGKMAEAIGVDSIPIDIGINRKEPIAGVLDRKIRYGTRNFSKEPAMTQEEAVKAIFTGMEIVSDCKKKGYHILAIGEMGIGNTTTSSAVAAALLRCETEEVTGRGAGLCDEKLQRKKQIITKAVKKYKLYEAEPLTVLQTVGGLDIAGLVGVCIGGGMFHIPIVLDGVISMTAALLAERIVQGTIQYLIPSHRGKEPAVEKLMKELKLEPVIDGRMALGEGTGAVMMLSLLEMTLCVYRRGTQFSDIQVEQYERY
ncbi:MAG: nicotinate-nucleotide--dimethylbenzimidazole phosphoribosyltransferase [Lachnospiraceae bacterium]|nr:nicotinate-nucleotide--dimethylbenzimidazole phosphoribosyltransferase [Lachnospiraceae bacterium]